MLSTYTLVDSRLNIGINNKVGLPHVLRQIDIFYENNHASSNIHKCAPYLVSGFLPAYLHNQSNLSMLGNNGISITVPSIFFRYDFQVMNLKIASV